MIQFAMVLLAAMALACSPIASGATLTGIVMDSAGKPLEDVRIDHTGKTVVVADVAVKPSPDEMRTGADGHFRVLAHVPAIVVRKPGYESQRILVNGDAQLKVTLRRIRSTSRCKLSAPPVFSTKEASDVDHTATWFLIETKDGPKGIISGSGPMYSWGAPSDIDVWASVEYEEVMYENGIIDAWGHSADGKYWRRRSIFGAATQYYGQSRETADKLDCVMDRVPMKVHP